LTLTCVSFQPVYAQNGINAPVLAGVSASAGSKLDDATVIKGVNTAGTVRVNCLANLDALLNIAANASELFGLMIGAGVLFCALKRLRKEARLSRGRVAIGVSFIAFALMAPKLINWSVAIARDSNFFS
jgi:hypothetical protein